jgi:hypothetical protein
MRAQQIAILGTGVRELGNRGSWGLVGVGTAKTVE